MHRFFLNTLCLYCLIGLGLCNPPEKPEIVPGSERMHRYLPLLKGQRIGLVVNHTSLVKDTHLVDTLLSRGVTIKKIFAPEHGFRGERDAGEKVENAVDRQTGLPLISLYGKNKKPTSGQLGDIDMVIFDIQDVGTRFYTYISTMHYVMEACGEYGVKVLILDRPNPNGDYIDGPVLDLEFQSFVGMHPIPIVHGLTVGELARMINGEKWMENGITCDLTVVPATNYHHEATYKLPVKPSPNLPNQQAVKLYPSLCLFEGTIISVGRGTYDPFQVIGYPDQKYGSFTFTPESIPGMAKYPKYEGQKCYGKDLRNIEPPQALDLRYLLSFYKISGKGKGFFNGFFDRLAGTDALRNQILSGMAEEEIRKSWQEKLETFKIKRKKYLLYPDSGK